MTVDDPRVVRACRWFSDHGWDLEINAGGVEAVMPSGYGSGPAVIDVIALVKCIVSDEIIGAKWDLMGHHVS